MLIVLPVLYELIESTFPAPVSGCHWRRRCGICGFSGRRRPAGHVIIMVVVTHQKHCLRPKFIAESTAADEAVKHLRQIHLQPQASDRRQHLQPAGQFRPARQRKCDQKFGWAGLSDSSSSSADALPSWSYPSSQSMIILDR
jgi:hypothetical protein